MSADRHLLFGLLALQCGFISPEQLVAAFSGWTSDKRRSLDQILGEIQAITPPQQLLLGSLVEEHLKLHGDDPERSLAALSTLPRATEKLELLADPDLNASLAAVHLDRDDRSELATTITATSPHSQRGRFVILRQHARGGLGQVSVALDRELHRHVALKEMLAKCVHDLASQQRFVQEAEITGQLEHPGIIPVYGLGTYDNGSPYYAMRFVEGDNLKRAIEAFHRGRKPGEQLSGARAVAFRKLLKRFVDVCNAIDYAHSRKVLHRDLKPENILLGPYGETLVVDWGLAKAQDSSGAKEGAAPVSRPLQLRSGKGSETIDGSTLGTPAYMSPEQAEGKVHELGPATDVYSLGATLYALITGAAPFKGDDQFDTLDKVRRGDFDRPRSHWSSIPRPLEAICLKAMSHQPQERYVSAREFSEEIEKWLADEPVGAFVEPYLLRMKRWIRRHPAVVSSAIATSLLLLLGVSLGAYLQIVHAKELAKRNLELIAAKAKAEARELDAIAAVQRFGDVVAKNFELKSNPKLEPLRKELLQEPLGFFRTLRERLQADSDTRPESLARLARAAFDLGRLTDEVGDKQNAIQSFREALTLREQLVRENPSDAPFRRELAQSHNNLGVLLHETGNVADASSSFEKAKDLVEPLVEASPSDAGLRHDLSSSRNNVGNLLVASGKPNEAIVAFEQAKSILEQLARDSPQVAEFQLDLAGSLLNIGILLGAKRKSNESRAAFAQAKAILERLVREHPGQSEFQHLLSCCHFNIGVLLSESGNLAESHAAYEESRLIRERLVRENPTVSDYQSRLGATLHNQAMLDLEAQRFSEARDRLLTAIEHQNLAVDANPQHPLYRQLLKNHLTNLIKAAACLKDAKLANDAERGLSRLAASDPEGAALDARIAKVLSGEAAPNAGELLAFGQRSYDLRLVARAARFFGEALEKEPALLEDRQAQIAYNAACSAALAGSGRGVDEPAPDDAARQKLRAQARGWLQGESERWAKLVEGAAAEPRTLVVMTLKHWQSDADLAGVRDEAELAKLPEAERKHWESLWAKVKELLAKAEGPMGSAGETGK